MIDRPLTADVLGLYRSELVRYASRLTEDREVPQAVMANVLPLQEWVDAASGPGDERARHRALARASTNRSRDRKPDNRPDLLIAEAETYYTYLKAV
jgi:Arc/MetJ-type ribon-helix-helix transcriptional regulator